MIRMKNTLHLLSGILLFASASLSRAQVPDYFQTNPVWHQYHTGLSISFNCWYTEHAQLRLRQDTLIGSETYHIISRYHQRHYGPIGMTTCDPDQNVMNPTFALLRQDSLQIYSYEISESAECLLYDFSWQTGDTIETSALCSSWSQLNDSIVVDSVITRSLPVVGMRKFFYWHYPGISWQPEDKYTIIEGLGGEGGLREVFCRFFEFNSELNCYWNNDTIVYAPGQQSCTQSLNIHSPQAPAATWQVAPNPTADKVFLTRAGAPLTGELKVMDVHGRLVYTAALTEAQSVVIDMQGMVPGVYLFSFQDAMGNISVHRQVKQ